ncbi:MAG: GAF domain-containing protein [Bryobacteraceae bacterium]
MVGSAMIARWLPILALAAACLPATAQERVTCADLRSRKLPNFDPALAGETVIVRGVASAPAFHFPDYTLAAIQDSDGGAVIQAPKGSAALDALRPGDEVEAEGVVAGLAGMPVVALGRIAVVGSATPPVPAAVSLRDLDSFPQNLRYLGRLVRTEGRVIEKSPTTAGGAILLRLDPEPYKLFLPGVSRMQDLGAFGEGDTLVATGVALQFCPMPPYTHYFELLVNSPTYILRTERGWFLPPLTLAAGLTLVVLAAYLLWSRERRLRKQRERLRSTYQLGEEILGASSTGALLKRISEALPGILGVTRVHLYVYNRAARTLEAAVEGGGEPVSISLSSPPAGTSAGAVACFHYRTLLVIPDIARSPFPISADEGEQAPQSLLFVPMLAQGEVMGVLELDQDDRPRDFPADEQALAQHLGNQIGVALRLLDQRSVQEQLFRTEKLAAVGRLISGVVNELRTPLASISEWAGKALEKGRPGPAEREIAAISSEANKAAEIVARLVTFGAETPEARPVSITALLRSLVEFRESDWKASGIRVENLVSREQLYVLGSEGQLEQVFLNLLVHAEQSLAEAPQKVITIRTSVLAKRLVVEIGFTAPPESGKAEETASVLGLARSVMAGHGGEVRLILGNNQEPRFEVELPAAARDRTAAAAAGPLGDLSRVLTTLLIEPDEAAQRHLLGLLSARACRVVPVGNSDTGLELAQRMRFDAAFCSVHAPGLNWVELSERMQSRVDGFILLSDGYDAELSADFEDDGRFVLPKPVQEPELDRVLRSIDRRAAVRA